MEYVFFVSNWLIKYNFNRPHQALDYLTPMRYIENYNENLKQKVLLMCPASTFY
ncbi:transposase [bacterium]|nr:transposase [bacterium]